MSDRVSFLLFSARSFVAEPRYCIDLLRTRWALHRERISPPVAPRYDPDPNWAVSIHMALRCPWPCDVVGEFRSIWAELSELLGAGDDPLGRGSDADQEFARALWCLVRHVKPRTIVETGVARGVTTRFILEGIAANGVGHLWSLDLPPLRDRWAGRVGMAAGDVIGKQNWTYIVGASARVLPRLLRELGTLDLFVHDSLHTEENMAMEFESAWNYLRSSGLLVSDDISSNGAFQRFASRNHATLVIGAQSKALHSGTGQNLFGLLIR